MIEIYGKAVVLGDNINTDVLAPGRWKLESMEVLKVHCLEGIVPNFVQSISLGDILVAGKDFGCGSHREQAVTVLYAMGIRTILADSVSRLYYRNCIALGMPILTIPGIRKWVKEGNLLRVIFTETEIAINNVTTKEKLAVPGIPEEMLYILQNGGIMASLREKLKTKEAEYIYNSIF